MTLFLPPLDDTPRPLYSVVAWPPEQLDTWMRRLQDKLNVRGFGYPHLNLRAPFQTPLSNTELLAQARHILKDQAALDIRIKGWKRLPSVIFLECELEPALADLHARLLQIGPSSRAPYDGHDYRPHLTLALGVLPCAEDQLWQQVQPLKPPTTHFTVEALSLTREERGEVLELHTFPLMATGTPEPAHAIAQAEHP